jgi:hypothetical protein
MIAFPAPPHFWDADLDGGWIIGLNLAHREGLVHGRDVVVSYGPLGWLRLNDVIDGGLGWNVLYRFTLYTVWLIGAARLVFCHTSKRTALWALSLMAIAAIHDSPPDHLGLGVIIFTALCLIETDRARTYFTTTLALLATICLLVKLNEGAAASLVFGSVVAVNTLRRYGITRAALLRIAAWYGVAAMIFVLAFIAATNSFHGLLPFLKYQRQIAAGFPLSMSLWGPPWQVTLAVVTVGGLLVGIPLVSENVLALAPA